MTLRLYDTAARRVRDFEPLVPGHVGIYLCGATVQAPPHIGHMRSGVAFDILRRWLEYAGNAVTFVRNVTDIDDKILGRAAAEDVPFWVVSTRNERAFTAAYDVLGCLPPTVEPRATGHIPEMITLMARLIDGGTAYVAEGSVYFAVTSYPAYGALSGQDVHAMQPAGDSDPGGRKRDPRDFALWKAAKPGEPSWPTPWGPGRPGWHLECSAMAERYLGSTFDIHGGGLDLVFPHHENEIAQSQAAGSDFARYWLHNGWLTLAGEKMSKSLGNSLLVSEMARRVRPVELRYYLGAAHYRSMLEYSEEALSESGVAYGRIEGFVRRALESVGNPPGEPGLVPDAFAAALDDDLRVPAGLAVVHEAVREGNRALTDGNRDAVARRLGEVVAMTEVLGVNPLAEPWCGADVPATDSAVLDALVAVALEQRQAARNRRDYAAADAIRDALAAARVVVEDTPTGPRWSLSGAGPRTATPRDGA